MAEAVTATRRFEAVHRFARISPRKARLVAALIRGQQVNTAQEILRFTEKKASGLIAKVLKAAIASANEQEADVRSLVVTESTVNEGPYLRRRRPKDRGRAHPILKRMGHLTVVVEER